MLLGLARSIPDGRGRARGPESLSDLGFQDQHTLIDDGYQILAFSFHRGGQSNGFYKEWVFDHFCICLGLGRWSRDSTVPVTTQTPGVRADRPAWVGDVRQGTGEEQGIFPG